MPLNNFDFPGVTFNQVFDSNAVSTPSTLSVLCVGTQYSLHKAGTKDEVEVPNDASYSATSGLTATITSAIGGTIDDEPSTHHLVVKNGAFLYYTATDIDATATTAAALANRTITFESPIKDGGGFEAATGFGSRGARVGDTVILTGTGSDTPIVTTILKIINVSGKGAVQMIVGNTDELTTLTSVGFCAAKDVTFEESASTFTLASGTLSINGNIQVIIDDVSAETYGVLQSGDFYIEYREALAQYVGKLGVVSSFNDLQEQLGPWCADNPLSLACYFALAGGRTVYFTGVADETGESYVTALDSLAKYTELYSIVPATEDRAIIEACMAYVKSISNDDEDVVRRALWYGVTADKNIQLWAGEATISTTTVTVDSESDDVYLDTNLQHGDVIALASDTSKRWTIASVDGPKALTIVAGTAITAGKQKYVILRTEPVAVDIVDNIVAKRCTQSERAMCVWADGLQFGGEDLPNYPLAAAAAGMRAAEYCHRPISNLGYSFFSLANTNAFTRDQLKLIGRNGIWIIANNQDGTPINMKQITTAIANDINRDEESIIANIDTIAMDVSRTGKERVGNSNISPDLIDALEDDLTIRMDKYKVNESGSAYIGPQLLDWELERIWQDPVNLDHIYASLWCQPPKPFNKFHITVRVI